MRYYIDVADKRNVYLKAYLTDKGYKTEELNTETINNVKSRDVCIFAPPTAITKERVAPLPEDVTIYGGKFNEEIKEFLNKKNIKTISFLSDEEFTIKNANLTAEGVLGLVIEKSTKSIFEHNILVIGNGRVAKAVSIIFEKLGIKTTLTARSNFNKAENYLISNESILLEDMYEKICKFDVVINSIPVKLFDSDQIKAIAPNTLFIETASVPCLDKELAVNFNYELAPALPQRFCVESAAKLMLNIILEDKND